MGRTVFLGAVALAIALGAWLLARDDDPGSPLPEANRPESTHLEAPKLTGRAAPPPPETARPAVLSGGARIHGYVRTEAGAAVPDVPVQLHVLREPPWNRATPAARLRAAFGHVDSSADTELLASTVSGADGAFTFRGVRLREEYKVRALPPAPFFPAEAWAGADPSWYADPVVVVVGKGAPLRLRVVDGAGRGLRAHVSGSIWRARAEAGRREPFYWMLPSAQTAPDGRLVVQGVPRGRLTLDLVVPERGARWGHAIDTPRDDEVVIRFLDPDGATLQGLVRDAGGRPVPGARVLVVVWAQAQDLGRVALGAVTGADGTYRVQGLPPGELETLSVLAPGFVFVENAAPALGLAAGEAERVDVTLRRGGVVEGVVTGPDGKGIAAARIASVALDEEGRQGERELRTATTTEGRFRFEAVPVGKGRLQASAPGWYQPGDGDNGAYHVTHEGQVLQVPVRLERGATLRGVVVDEAGAPVPRVDVRLTLRGAGPGWIRRVSDRFTDDAGRFLFDGLPPWTRWRVQARGRTGIADAVDLRVESGQEPEALCLVLHAGAVIAGQVQIEGQSPGVRPRVHCRPEVGHSQTRAVGRDGTFVFDGVPAGALKLYVVSGQATQCSEAVELDVAWGQRVRGVVLRAPRLDEIAGVVVDGSGGPAAGVRVRVSAQDARGQWHQATEQTGSDGRFHFHALPDLEYVLLAGRTKHPGPVRVGVHDLRVVQRPPDVTPITVEGTVTDAAGRPVPLAEIDVVRHLGGRREKGSIDVRRGHFHHVFSGGADRVDLRVVRPRDLDGRPLNLLPRWVEDAEVAAGPVAIQLDEGLVLRGRVDGPPPEVLGNLQVRLRSVTGGSGSGRDRVTHETEVEADGTFRFVALETGEFVLSLAGAADWVQSGEVLVVRAGRQDVVVPTQRAAPISGRVKDAGGRPVEGCTVHFFWNRPDGPRATRHTSTIQGGLFSIPGVPLGARGTLRVLYRAAANKPLLGWAQVPAAAGALRMDIGLEPGVFVSGQVTQEAGEAVPRPYLLVWPLDAPVMGLHTHYYGAQDGTFSLGPMPPGSYRVEPLDRRGHPAGEAVPVVAPSTGVRLRFEPR